MRPQTADREFADIFERHADGQAVIVDAQVSPQAPEVVVDLEFAEREGGEQGFGWVVKVMYQLQSSDLHQKDIIMNIYIYLYQFRFLKYADYWYGTLYGRIETRCCLNAATF